MDPGNGSVTVYLRGLSIGVSTGDKIMGTPSNAIQSSATTPHTRISNTSHEAPF